MIYQIYPQDNPLTANVTARGTIFGTCAGLTLAWARNVVTTQGQGLAQVTDTQPNMLRATQTQTTWAANGANAALNQSEVQLANPQNLGSAEQGFAGLTDPATRAGVYILTLQRSDNVSHMVGVMKQDQNNYLYFEPNAGLFLCTSANEFRNFTTYNWQRNFSTADPTAVSMSSRQLLNRLNEMAYPPTPALRTVPLPPHSYPPPQPQQTPFNLPLQQATSYQAPPAPRQQTVPLPDSHLYPPQPRQSTSNSRLPDSNYRPPPAPRSRTLPLPPESAALAQPSSDPRSQITEPQAAHLQQRDATRDQVPQDTRRLQHRQQQPVNTQPQPTADMSTRARRTANTGTQQPAQPSGPSCCRR